MEENENLTSADIRYLERKKRYIDRKKANMSSDEIERVYEEYQKRKGSRVTDKYLSQYKFLKSTDITRKFFQDISYDGFFAMVKSHYIAMIDPNYRLALNRQKYHKVKKKLDKYKEKVGDRPNFLQDRKIRKLEKKMLKLSYKSRNIPIKKSMEWFTLQHMKIQEEYTDFLNEGGHTKEEIIEVIDICNEKRSKLNEMSSGNMFNGADQLADINKCMTIESFNNKEYWNRYKVAYNADFKAPKIRFEDDGMFKKKMVIDNPIYEGGRKFDPFYARKSYVNPNRAIHSLLDQIQKINKISGPDKYLPKEALDNMSIAKYDSIGGYFRRMRDAVANDCGDMETANRVMDVACLKGEGSFLVNQYLYSISFDDQDNYNKFAKIVNSDEVTDEILRDPEKLKYTLGQNRIEDENFINKTIEFTKKYYDFVDSIENYNKDLFTLKNPDIKAHVISYSTSNKKLETEGTQKSYESLSLITKNEKRKVNEKPVINSFTSLKDGSSSYIEVKPKKEVDNELEP